MVFRPAGRFFYHLFSTTPLSVVVLRLSHSTASASLCLLKSPLSLTGFQFLDFPLNILYTIGWLLSIPSAIKASSIRIFCHFVPMSCVSYQPLHLPPLMEGDRSGLLLTFRGYYTLC